MLGPLRSKAQAMASISQMSLLSPKDAAALGKSVGLRPKESPLLELSFDPLRFVYYNNIHTCI